MILIISFPFLFEIQKENPFPDLAALFSVVFISNFFIEFEDKLLTNAR